MNYRFALIPVIWLRGNAALKRPFMGSLASGQIGWKADGPLTAYESGFRTFTLWRDPAKRC